MKKKTEIHKFKRTVTNIKHFR